MGTRLCKITKGAARKQGLVTSINNGLILANIVHANDGAPRFVVVPSKEKSQSGPSGFVYVRSVGSSNYHRPIDFHLTQMHDPAGSTPNE